MEGRESMPGSFSAILQNRGAAAQHHHHHQQGLRPAGLNPSHANPNAADSATIASASAVPGHMGMAMVRTGAATEPMKRKRGRPRKYGPDGSMALALAPMSSSAQSSGGPFSPLQKRGRGRPPGSGRRQQLAALGSAGVGFAPHVITISAGEDVATKIMSFSQQGPRAVCILSANGAISNATLRQPATSGGTVTYEGRFEILSLSGSFLLTENGGTRSRTGGLSISLAGPDGRVIGGGVAGMLMAASPVQVIVGSFISSSRKPQSKQAIPGPDLPLSRPSVIYPGGPAGPAPVSRAGINDSSAAKCASSSSPPQNQSSGIPTNVSQPQFQSMPPYQTMGWQISHSSGDLRRDTDINIPLQGG